MQIEIQNIQFRYNSFMAGTNNVLDGINLKIGTGEFIALVGPTGSGKTTLVQHFTGLLTPTRGKVLINGQELAGNKNLLLTIRRKIGLVFQFPETQLFEETVFDDVAFGPKNLGLKNSQIQDRVHTALKLVNLNPEDFGSRSPYHLSEGEKRRVAIAGILAMDPDVLVLDEPTAGLDPGGIRIIEAVLSQLHTMGKTIFLITHNMDLVARVARRVVVLKRGKILFDNNKENLFARAELLATVGLELPRIVKVLNRYRQNGVNLPEKIYSIDQLQRITGRIIKHGLKPPPCANSVHGSKNGSS